MLAHIWVLQPPAFRGLHELQFMASLEVDNSTTAIFPNQNVEEWGKVPDIYIYMCVCIYINIYLCMCVWI